MPVETAERPSIKILTENVLREDIIRDKRGQSADISVSDAKEFSLDTVEAVSFEGPASVTCGGGKCIGPCVQRCLPQPPSKCGSLT